ncbi:bifunctional UDP-3-O-[3-hydroxymyristoyl] N-acetylglucosamine deacetylase/3-hydroxyacyl-ACP dehydratase [Opitutus sp. GAS368]|jgi:UDP-3-O-[3-hydroxymyristoyl] N-acetylglucosamine deacetylase/3-hydroxyacyl-[acyl-carrier-protein] dehydratase|uniref:bifunctional UDP-3-O-[3-hydroxymyristoyl] N-acetylglucosamine deacetylase/3-hydroxyacyl-ACP dehydratase n=1 Tax=Opitutus sp. GAS368 TaxID=1882749 RepID=UPI0008793167|nr:bifunctional UDP-3-O-[3-hydroxymyristoyl] N-acetylglucosamine deacetylase/3-hydroxyacyl-ACP dehydratase [Opitutus sp. GAS368]SDR67299.1 3-hydroxyacyl-[acyl-carrier-protein] dehydratase /UDP-3-O-[3-hydroxymyristoyl] N-acetylglucosamine deacetylase [Opitutus sp. GAS368]
MKQRTLLREVSIKGNALHTGDAVHLTLKPAPANHGIVFRRVDLHGHPEIKPRVDLVTDLVRATTIQQGHAKIHTVEHVLSALSGCGVDNIVIEMDASEPPIMDGSAREFVKLIQQGEPVEQDAEREYFALAETISVSRGNSSIIALPYDGLKITCTSADDRGIHTQHLSLVIDPEVYTTQVAAARTFTIYEDIEELLKLGKIKGGSLDSAIVIKGDKIISKEPLRFNDEFVRHKILDIIGDITLLGLPLKAHIVATRPGHALNAELTKQLFEKYDAWRKGGKKAAKPAAPKADVTTETTLDIRRVLDMLPHRYPFVMVDRVVELKENELVAIKNVTINEPFFQGHYPGNPVMPGVLQVEAMAQAAGILLLRQTNMEGKTALFMSCDKVKWRKPVRPGDQLLIKVKMTKLRGSIACAEGECSVNGQVVSAADLMFAVVDNSAMD